FDVPGSDPQEAATAGGTTSPRRTVDPRSQALRRCTPHGTPLDMAPSPRSDPPLDAERGQEDRAHVSRLCVQEVCRPDLREDAEVPVDVPLHAHRAAEPDVRAVPEEDGDAGVEQRLPRGPAQHEEGELGLHPLVVPEQRGGAYL